ncbi:hypothetical protein TRFO_38285 [Tritrichomonas foetus]|uniref:Uncharacterized protein n=1 Tax=Tritrichomonas foetus TaxID=1144522 RepID=A0A1J4J8Y2_9EUKA|nr:hypothetical protein TRFO_38285 [Tritrichomonas foetus]|eukprot:OHS95600.1 hypothetical protein TRFO_38285 [Tritrichomonas foetus]
MFFYGCSIHNACITGEPKVVKLFFKFSDLDINILNKYNKAWYHLLLGQKTHKVIKIIRILIKHGFDINHLPNDKCDSILTSFVLYFKRDFEVIEFLLKNGADAKIMTTQKKPLFDRIQENMKMSYTYPTSYNKDLLAINSLFLKYQKKSDNVNK